MGGWRAAWQAGEGVGKGVSGLRPQCVGHFRENDGLIQAVSPLTNSSEQARPKGGGACMRGGFSLTELAHGPSASREPHVSPTGFSRHQQRVSQRRRPAKVLLSPIVSVAHVTSKTAPIDPLRRADNHFSCYLSTPWLPDNTGDCPSSQQ